LERALLQDVLDGAVGQAIRAATSLDQIKFGWYTFFSSSHTPGLNYV